jgi:transposase InsO family protein
MEVLTPSRFAKACKNRASVFAVLKVPEDELVLPDEDEPENSSNPDRIPPELQDYAPVFEVQNSKIMPPRKETDHEIGLEEGSVPPHGPIYPLSQAELKVLREYLDENLKNGRIRPSKSPAGAPILFVPKKDGGLRLCVDYRGLNKVSIKNRYPLPLISEILDRLAGVRYFSKVDVQDAYYRIRIKEGDEWKTAFRTRYGHFEYMVMPFGLTNAPATFQSYIHTALQGLLDISCIAYLDDILIFSKNREQHTKHIRQVLERLQNAQLFAKASKCTFYQSEVEFLGFIVGRNGVSMDERRVTAIQEWQQPQSFRDIQVFLGFCNFYRRFIYQYSLIALPLTELLKGSKNGRKPGSVELDERESGAFRTLLDAFKKAPLLRFFDPSRPIRIETDASGFGMAGILSQPDDRKIWHPVAFWSKKFTSTERNYSTSDHELYAIVWSFKHWRQYLEGSLHRIEVLSDHDNLRLFMQQQNINGRQARWCLYLTPFDFVIKHRSGRTNPADGLSRTPGVEKPPPVDEVLGPIRTRLEGDRTTISVQELIAIDKDFKEESGEADPHPALTQTLARGKSSGTGTQSISKQYLEGQEPGHIVQIGSVSIEFQYDSDGVGEESILDSTADSLELGDFDFYEELSRAQYIPSRVVYAATAVEDAFTEGTSDELESLVAQLQFEDVTIRGRKEAVLKGEPVGRHWNVNLHGLLCYNDRLYIPVSGNLRAKLIELCHDDPLAGHFGRNRTEELLKRKYHWEGLADQVRSYVKTCPVCQRVKAPRHRPYGQLHSLPVPTRPFAELTMDFITGLPPVWVEGKLVDAILVIVDRLTKYSRFLAVSTTITAGELAELFYSEIELEYGNPEGIVSDRGSVFTSEFWSKLCYHSRIKLRFSTAFHPQTDGQTERMNQVLEDYLRCFVDEQRTNWPRLLKTAQFASNNAINQSTKKSPFELLLGYSPNFQLRDNNEEFEKKAPAAVERLNRLRNVQEKAKKAIRIAQESHQKGYNKRHKPKVFQKRDLVMLSTRNLRLKGQPRKLSPRWIGPFRVQDRVGSLAYRLILPNKYERLHDVFPVSLLESWNSRSGNELLTMPDLDEDEEWEVEEVCDERIFDGEKHFYVKWKDWPSEYNSWEPSTHMNNARRAIISFQKRKDKNTSRKSSI